METVRQCALQGIQNTSAISIWPFLFYFNCPKKYQKAHRATIVLKLKLSFCVFVSTTAQSRSNQAVGVAVTIWTCILEVPRSNIFHATSYPDGFLQSLQLYVGIVHRARSRPSASKSLLTHNSCFSCHLRCFFLHDPLSLFNIVLHWTPKSTQWSLQLVFSTTLLYILPMRATYTSHPS
jgi:hypothetical protein